MAPWNRYNRDLNGAWHAIDDLRDRVERIEVRSATLWQVISFIGVAAAVGVAIAAFIYH